MCFLAFYIAYINIRYIKHCMHTTRSIHFCLCVDDFGVKYINKDDIHHLITSLQKHYTISCDWSGKNYCGYQLEWHYYKGYVDLSMPKWIPKTLTKLSHSTPTKPQFSPHKWNTPQFGKNIQQPTPFDTAPHHPPQGKNRIQSIVGSLLYYGRALDSTILPALNDIAHQ